MDEATAGRLQEKLLGLYATLEEDEKDLFAMLMAASTAEVEGYGIRAYGGFGNFMAQPYFEQSNVANVQLQQLMSRYNQAETLASNVQKKADDTSSGTIGKIGG